MAKSDQSVTLRCGDAVARVLLHGAELVSYCDRDGREYIWQGDPAVWDQHAPVLFPMCGHALGNQVTYASGTYPMPVHGFAHSADFSVYRQEEASVDLLLTASEHTRATFPFDFALHVIYAITEYGFTTRFTVENRSGDDMPFCIGGHPGLNIAFRDDIPESRCRLTFDAPVSPDLDIVIEGGYLEGKQRLAEIENGVLLPLTHAMIQSRDTLLFSDIASRAVTLTGSDGFALRMTYGSFPHLAVWTSGAQDADYVCLEPWYGLPGSPSRSARLEDTPGAVVLAPGAVFSDSFTVQKA